MGVRREESGLPGYNKDKIFDHANITNIIKRRLYMLLKCRHGKPAGEWHPEGGGRRINGMRK